MKNILVIISILLLFNCNNTIGSDDVIELTNLEFSIDVEKDVTSTALIVKGSVINLGTTKVSSPWYIEGMFYSDNNLFLTVGFYQIQ